MIKQKLELTDSLAQTKQNINYYRERRDALKSSTSNSKENIEQVDQQLENVNQKITTLIDDVKLTADDYYENITFQNAYSILVPASNTATSTLKLIINNVKTPLILGEGVIFVLYFVVAFVDAMRTDALNRKRKKASEAENSGNEEENKE